MEIGVGEILAAQHIAAGAKLEMKRPEGKHARVGQQHTRIVERLSGILVGEVIIHVAGENRLHVIVARSLLVVENHPIQVHEAAFL